MATSEPILNVPRSVTGVAVLLVAVQFIRGLLPDELDLTLLLALAFIPARYSGAALELPGGYLTAVTSFVTYMVVHAGWVHLVVNLLWMLAFGSAVARRMGDLRFLGFSVLCGIAGAFTHLLFHYGDMAPVVGASAAISGQMAGALRFIFRAQRLPGQRTPDFVGAPLHEPRSDLERQAHPRVPGVLGRAQRLFRPQRREDRRRAGVDCVGGPYRRVSVRLAASSAPSTRASPPRLSPASPRGRNFPATCLLSCASLRSGTECRSRRG